MVEDYWVKSHPTGSNYICNPPVIDTDIDTVVLLNKGDLNIVKDIYLEHGWSCPDNSSYPTGLFIAFRKDVENHIVMEDASYFDKWVDATEKAKELNLLGKADRIKLFAEYLKEECF